MLFNSLSIFVYNLDLSNFLSESGLSYFSVLSICLPVQVPGPKKSLILGVSLTHSVESRDPFFLKQK